MKTQKWFLLVGLAIALVLVLNACAPPAEVVEEPTPTEAVVEEPTPTEAVVEEPTPAEEVVEIVYMRFVEESDVPLELVDEFNAAHPNIQVVVDNTPAEDTYAKLVLTSEAGDPPDVFNTYWTLGAATNGLALDLGPFIEAEGEEWFENLVESGWLFHTFAGKYYAAPYRVSPSVVFLNLNLLEKAGLEVPTDWTWENFVAYAQAMTNPEEDEFGFCIMGSAEDPGTDYQYYPFLFQAGGRMIGDDGLSAFNSDAGVEALQFMVDLINEYKVVPPATTSATANTCIDLFGADKVGMWTNADLWRGIIRRVYPGVSLAIAPMPTNKTTGALCGGTGLGIASGSEHPEAAWEFIKFMVSDESMRRWALGGGFSPPNISLAEDPTYLADDPEVETVAHVLQTQRIFPLSHYPEGYSLESILRAYQQAAYTMDMTPEDALAAAAAEWDPVLEEYVAYNWWDAWLR